MTFRLQTSIACTSAMLMSLLVGACVTMSHGTAPYQMITGESLRSMIVDKIVTFPRGYGGTGARCYIFDHNRGTHICGDRGIADFGRFEVSEDRVCTMGMGSASQCWQFLRGRTGGYKIRYLAFHPEPVDEPVCIEAWKGAVEPCRLPSPTV